MSWSCPHCETLNDSHNEHCEVCGANRVASAHWVCPNCETENADYDAQCEVCGFEQSKAILYKEEKPQPEHLYKIDGLSGPYWKVPGKIYIVKKERIAADGSTEDPYLKPASGRWERFKRLSPDKKKSRMTGWAILAGLGLLLWGPSGWLTWYLISVGALFVGYKSGLPLRKRIDEWLEEGYVSPKGFTEVETKKEKWEDGHRSPVSTLTFNASGEQLISVDERGVLIRWNAETGEKRRVGTLMKERFDKALVGSSAAFVLDGDKVKVVRPDGTIRSSLSIKAIRKTPGYLTTRDSPMVLSGQQKWLAVGCINGEIQILNTANFTQSSLGGSSASEITSLAFFSGGPSTTESSSDRFLVSGSKDGEVKVYSPQDKKTVFQFQKKGASVKSVCTAGGKMGETFAAGYDNGEIRIWDSFSSGEGRIFNLNDEGEERGSVFAVQHMQFIPGKNWLATVNQIGIVQVWDLNSSTPALVRMFEGPTGDVRCLTVSPDGHKITIGGGDGSVAVFDIDKISESESLMESTAPKLKGKGVLKTEMKEREEPVMESDSKIEGAGEDDFTGGDEIKTT